MVVYSEPESSPSRNVKKGTGQHTVGKKSCHVNEINFLSKKFAVAVQIVHHFEAF